MRSASKLRIREPHCFRSPTSEFVQQLIHLLHIGDRCHIRILDDRKSKALSVRQLELVRRRHGQNASPNLHHLASTTTRRPQAGDARPASDRAASVDVARQPRVTPPPQRGRGCGVRRPMASRLRAVTLLFTHPTPTTLDFQTPTSWRRVLCVPLKTRTTDSIPIPFQQLSQTPAAIPIRAGSVTA